MFKKIGTDNTIESLLLNLTSEIKSLKVQVGTLEKNSQNVHRLEQKIDSLGEALNTIHRYICSRLP